MRLFTVLPLVLALNNPLATVQAAVTTYTDAAQFLAATGNPTAESFEQLTPKNRAFDPISVPGFSLTGLTAPVGVQNGADSPETGFGASATDGAQYLLIYLPGDAPGTLRFDLAAPAIGFGLYLTDLGEAGGTLTVSTDLGEAQNTVTLANFSPALGGGSVLFFGFTQTTPFTQIFLSTNGIDEAYGLDQVSVQTVPIPAAGWLFLSGLLAVAGRYRRSS